MSKRSRSDAARRGWATRRRRQAEQERERQRRSVAAKRGWETRRRKSGGAAPPPPPPPPAPPLPIFDVQEIEPGMELGFAYSEEIAYGIAEDAKPDMDLVSVRRAFEPVVGPCWLATYTFQEHELEPPEDVADEWEIGFEYRGAERGSHVDVNFRLAREDGEAFGATEAQRVFDQFRDNLGKSGSPIPDGYLMAWIDWRRPSRRSETWRGSDDTVDLEAFMNPMYVEADNESAWAGPTPNTPTRMGSIKK